jgi:thiamine-phosphate pyrophosphorylase
LKSNNNYYLQFITDRVICASHGLEKAVELAIQGGVNIVQLREKHLTTNELLPVARRLKSLLQYYKVPLIINDRVDLALMLDADGVHLGQTDMPYPHARKLLGKEKIIGLSVSNREQIERAEAWDVNYLGIGPIFKTNTKLDADKAIGLAGLQQLRRLSRHVLLAIGGIDAQNAHTVLQAGADGIAVVSAIGATANPQQAAQQLTHILQQVKTDV